MGVGVHLPFPTSTVQSTVRLPVPGSADRLRSPFVFDHFGRSGEVLNRAASLLPNGYPSPVRAKEGVDMYPVPPRFRFPLLPFPPHLATPANRPGTYKQDIPTPNPSFGPTWITDGDADVFNSHPMRASPVTPTPMDKKRKSDSASGGDVRAIKRMVSVTIVVKVNHQIHSSLVCRWRQRHRVPRQSSGTPPHHDKTPGFLTVSFQGSLFGSDEDELGDSDKENFRTETDHQGDVGSIGDELITTQASSEEEDRIAQALTRSSSPSEASSVESSPNLSYPSSSSKSSFAPSISPGKDSVAPSIPVSYVLAILVLELIVSGSALP